ncbi:MAG: hypothetical protein II319_01990 [Clostridia bacterium]|nr:hypothetical protein [Clostridia bacterium]
MIIKTMKSLKRAPVRAVAVLLFAAIISMIICALQATNEAELRNYEELYRSIPITMTVTTPAGTNTDRLTIDSWIYDLFTGWRPVEILGEGEGSYRERITEVSLAEYVKDVKSIMSQNISTINGKNFTSALGSSLLIGISSVSVDKRLLPEYGCEIKWYEGYDESIFESDELVCLIPEEMAKPRYYDNGNGEAELYFHRLVVTVKDGGSSKERESYEFRCTLKIVGTYTAGDGKGIYCPIPIIEQVCTGLETTPKVELLSATLADNTRLEEFREKMSTFFIEPSPDGDEIPLGLYVIGPNNNPDQNQYEMFSYKYYKYALDIDEVNLDNISNILENSIKFNRTVTVFVVILSVISGFLVGFLMVRRRKRDIMLMRMVGESNARVYAGFALEQMICIILGIAIGGAYYKWNPMDKLAIFAIAYFIALSLALAIFMSKKLIKNIKEDE